MTKALPRKFHRILLAAFAAWGVASTASTAVAAIKQPQAQLRSVNDGGLYVVSLDIPASATYKVSRLENPNRLVIDLDGVRIGSLVGGTGEADGILGARLGHAGNNASRIVLDLKETPMRTQAHVEDAAAGMRRLLVQWRHAPRAIDFSQGVQVAQAATGTLSDAAGTAAGAKQRDNKEWTLKAIPQLTYAPYRGAPTRKRLQSTALNVDAEFRNQVGIAAGTNHSDLTMYGNLPRLSQNTQFVSGRVNLSPAGLPGRLTLRADAYSATNNDATNETNGVRVLAPQVAFLSNDASRYFDLGYARSRYGDSNAGNGTLTVRQWTPTAGFALNGGADWLQLRVYDIRVSNAARAMGSSGTDAVEAKWTHYMAQAGWMPEQLQWGALVGKRIYAVDGDAGVLYNLADMQRGGVSAGAQWKLAANTRLLVNAGYDRYETQVTGTPTSYTGRYLFTGISAQW